MKQFLELHGNIWHTAVVPMYIMLLGKMTNSAWISPTQNKVNVKSTNFNSNTGLTIYQNMMMDPSIYSLCVLYCFITLVTTPKCCNFTPGCSQIKSGVNRHSRGWSYLLITRVFASPSTCEDHAGYKSLLMKPFSQSIFNSITRQKAGQSHSLGVEGRSTEPNVKCTAQTTWVYIVCFFPKVPHFLSLSLFF